MVALVMDTGPEGSMGGEENGLTLRGLARKLEALTEKMEAQEVENERVRSENARLHREVKALKDPGAGGTAVVEESGFEGRVSRRALLTKAGAATVAAVAAGTLMHPRPAKANHFDSGIEVEWVHTHEIIASAQFSGTAVFVGSTNTTQALSAENSGTGAGVRASGGTGVWGSSGQAGFSGVYGQHTGSGYGVVGDGRGVAPNAGVLGRNSSGHGVRGEGQFGVVGVGHSSGNGVLGRISDINAQAVRGEAPQGVGVGAVGARGVWGHATRTGDSGVLGEFVGSGAFGYGVTGVGKGNGAGVWGRNSGIGGAGVRGEGQSGYGGQFGGGKAQLKLTPGASAGRPTTGSHLRGEIFMGSTGALFVCTADGTPGTWRRVTTTVA